MPIGTVVENKVAQILAAAETPLVSVIVRTMGRHELREALDSVAAQTYPGIEVIVVDAVGSGFSGLLGACGAFPLRVVGRVGPLRRSEAANLGLAEARGTYLILLDEDDWFLPNHLAALVAALEQAPEALVAYAGVWLIGPGEEAGDVLSQPFSAVALRSGNFIPVNAALVRRSVVERGFRFDEELDAYEDWDFWLQLSRAGEFVHVDQVSACYRAGGASGVGLGANSVQQRAGRERVYAKWREIWTAAELNEMGEERNELALRLRGLALQKRETLAESQSRIHALEEQLVRIDQSWSIALTKPLRSLKSTLKKLKHALETLAEGRSVQLDYRPHISTLGAGAATRALSGPLISVVVPVYNACRSNSLHLVEALESIYQQTYRRIEMVIVDDGSTDETPEMCKRFLADHVGIPIRYCRKENGGQSSSRNLGVALSRGEWVSFLDQDDVWFPDKLERVLPLLGEGVDLVYSDADTIDEHSRRALVGLHRNYRFGLPHPKRNIEDVLFRDVFVMPGLTTVRKALVLKAGGFDESLSGYEDDDLFLRLFPLASMTYLPESTFWWRIYKDNYSNTIRMVRSRTQYWKKLMDGYTEGERNRHRVIGISRRFFREFLRQAIQQKRQGMALYRENLKAGREIVRHLPLWEKLAFGYPAPLWCVIASRSRPVVLGIEFIWRHSVTPTR
ncbi:MAG TPA: glycosyltransferase [Thermoanaerobaculaceae bacterium]|nr:glycosyltransferase [Thermoanaerobaculaceae bacterium]